MHWWYDGYDGAKSSSVGMFGQFAMPPDQTSTYSARWRQSSYMDSAVAQRNVPMTSRT